MRVLSAAIKRPAVSAAVEAQRWRGSAPRRAQQLLKAAALGLLAATGAAADEFNHQNLLVGTRSSGMGGADVAFADSATGVYYNPAGVSEVDASLVSVSLSAYRVDLSGVATIEARPETASRAAGFQFASFPLNFGLVTQLGDALGLTSHTLSLNFFVEDNSISGTRVDVRLPQIVDLYLRVRRDAQETIRFGPTWAAQRGPLSFGISLGYQLRVESRVADTLIELEDSVTYRLRTTDGVFGGLLAQAGVLWRIDDQWRVGASLTSPTARIHGEAVTSVAEVRSGNVPELSPSQRLPMLYRQPARLSLGVGYRRPSGFQVGFQVTGYAPVARYEVVSGVQQAEGVAIANVNLGTQLPLTSSWVLRLGAFTNFSATPTPKEIPDGFDDPSRLPHVHYYGATLGLTVYSGASSLDLSLVYQHGRGIIPADASRGYDPVISNVFVLNLGGTYNFTRDDSSAAKKSEAEK